MRQINIAELIYNHCIALHKRYYKLFSKHINAFQLMKHLTKLKRTTRFEYMSKLCSQAVQNIAESIECKVNTVPYYGVQATTVKRDAVADIYVYLVCDTQSAPVDRLGSHSTAQSLWAELTACASSYSFSQAVMDTI